MTLTTNWLILSDWTLDTSKVDFVNCKAKVQFWLVVD